MTDYGQLLTEAERMLTRVCKVQSVAETHYENAWGSRFAEVAQSHPKLTVRGVTMMLNAERAVEGGILGMAHRMLARATHLRRRAEDRMKRRKRLYFDSRSYGQGG